jgi:hypothetical protein
MVASNTDSSCSVGWLLKAQKLHLVLSLHCSQTFVLFVNVGKSFDIKSTAFGMDKPRAQAKRLTETEARAENCGE